MLGVIIAYPGSSAERFKEVHHGIHFSDDGFAVGHIPTIDAERKILTYSNKTLVVVDAPDIVLWNIYRKYFPTMAEATFLTSVVNGAQRLNFFMNVWLKVAEAKPIRFAKASSDGHFCAKFHEVFSTTVKGPIHPYRLVVPAWSDYSKNIISTMCPNWKNIQEIINGGR